jgi:uncharacterized repeat protein (TIGR03803 family)
MAALACRLAAVFFCLPPGMRALAAGAQMLEGHVPRVTAELTPVGRLDAGRHLSLTIALPLRDTAGLAKLVRELSEPGSGSYRHYLTPGEFTARFGPTTEDYEAVAAFAQAHNLRVTRRYANRLVLDVDGAVGDIEKTLHVTMRVYEHPTEGRTFYAPDREPSLDLTAPIAHIGGLDNYELPRPRVKIGKMGAGSARSVVGKPEIGSGPGDTYMGGDFRNAYVPGVTLTGSGQAVGLLEFDGYTTADILYYENLAGLPDVPLNNELLDNFNGHPTNTDGPVEVSLDIEMAISMAPGLNEVIVYEAGPNGSWHDILNQMASDDTAKALSCSWYIPSGTEDPVADEIFQEMAAQGQSFFSASGDSDAYTGLIPFPGDSPYITQVGGTELTDSGTGGAWESETTWNWGYDTNTDSYVGSSGGISTQYSIPYWQQPISMATNQGSTTMRNTPDVALTADDVYVREGNENQSVGGTSCAAPLWAAFTALVDQQAGANPVGFINPAVYTIATGSQYTTDFHDITTGNNFSSSSPSKFAAVAGYDLCTGLGTPAGANLINALAQPVDNLQLTATTFLSAGPVGGPFSPGSYGYTISNSGSTSLAWSASITQSWLTLSATSGTLAASGSATVTASINANANALASGTYTDTITFTDVGTGFSRTSPISLDVLTQPAIDSALTATATNGSPFSYQITATNDPTSFGAAGLPTGLSVNTSSGFITGTATVNGTDDVTISAIGAGGTGSAILVLTVQPSAPVITGTLTATAPNGSGFSYQITATNNPSSYGATHLPSGLHVNTSTGVISGTTTATGTDDVTIKAINASGTGSATLVLTVLPPLPVINSSLTATASNGIPFSYQISATNNPTSYGATGLPTGLEIAGTTDEIVGTTTQTGTSNVTLSASNAAGTGTADLVLTVLPPAPAITGTLIATASNGAAFSYQIMATNNPTSFGATGLPAGFAVNTSSGIISGSSTTTGSTNVTISASNTGGTGTAMLALIVLPPIPVITSSLTATAIVGAPFSYVITASGSPASYNASGLPGGLGVNMNTGLISGTASASGTASVGISASNAAGTGTATLLLTILPAPPPMIITGTLTTLCSFTGTGGAYPGAGPATGLVQGSSGSFFGTAQSGGASNDGDVFAVTSQGAFAALCSFTGSTSQSGSPIGASPRSHLIQATDDYFYGTTMLGGTGNGGTVFRVSQGGGSASLLTFTGSNGLEPTAGVIQATNGNFYGTTEYGGAYGKGTVFMITSGGSLTTLCSFTGTNGAYPVGGLIQTTSGTFYGTTSQGGNVGDGTAFKITSSGSLTTLCSFSGTNGAYPMAGLALATDGNFYGTTYEGGTAGDGTIFRLATSGSLTMLCSFTGVGGANPGEYPEGALIQGNDGNIYGTTSIGGAANYGMLFNIALSGSLTPLYSFEDGSDGAEPLCSLMQVSNGGFMGTASAGGANGLGTVYTFVPALIVSGTQGFAFAYQINATNSPTSYNATGLPGGLTVNTTSGLISGTASGSGTSSVTVSASNPGGTGTAILTFVMAPSPLPAITSGTVIATENQPLTYQVNATNSPSSYGETGLPAGLTISSSSGIISGTATSTGTSTVTVTASNVAGTGTGTITLLVETPYVAWQDEVFTSSQLANPAISGDTADPAGDGISNLLKYALGLNPFVDGVSGLPVESIAVTGSGNYLSLTYMDVLSDTDLTYTVQVSTDLETWNSGPGYTSSPSIVTNPGGLTESVTVQSAAAMSGTLPMEFMRLQVMGL